ncbi:alpha/beta fold hydrolase [Pseudarthrobacter sp. S9]|uniref:alpha/beta fold hydrolase n=1 Tax=Pseudarthrobacter sp. S9 TaxID=3418421 RepID=UPI003CFDC588
MSTVSLANGISIGYEEQGDGYPVVLLPGSAVDHQIFTPGGQFSALSENFRVVALDWRGTGESDRPGNEYWAPDLADDVIGVLDALNIDKAHIVGMSQGATIAIRLAAEHPERVNRLVLYSPWDHSDNFLARQFRIWQHLYATADPLEYGKATLWWLLSPEFINGHPDMVDGIAEASFAGEAAASRHAQVRSAHINELHDARDQLPDIKALTLVIAGEDDRTIPVAYSRRTAEAIAGAKIEVLTGPGASHAHFLERGEEVTKHTVNFLLP